MKTGKTYLEKTLQGMAMGMAFWIWLVTIGAAYATWNTLTQINTASSGSTLTSSEWNKMVANFSTIDDKLVPTGAVMAFFGSTCPNGWSPANGTANGVKKTDGTNGTLDLRGEFIRGLDSGRGVDTGRSLASSQDGSKIAAAWGNPSPPYLWSNQYFISTDNGSNTSGYTPANLEEISSINFSGNFLQGWYTYINSSTISNYGKVRPRNVALLYCVKN